MNTLLSYRGRTITDDELAFLRQLIADQPTNIASYNPNGDYKIYGRGGTDFTPVVDYYNENTRKYSCLIYLTDGEAPAPETVKGRVLWALSSTSQETNHLPGITIKLN